MAVLGDIVIHVPPNINIVNKIFPVLSDVAISDNICNKGGSKNLILTGNVVLGEIKVKIKRP
jgi:hypothetical protein